MKTIIFILLIGFTTSCVAQKKIANLKNNTTEKASVNKYNVKIEAEEISLNNISNKFTSVKQTSPNMSSNETNLLAPLVNKKAQVQLTRICVNNISLNELQKLTKDKYPWLTMRIRTDLNGKPIELEFYMQTNSILTLNQLENIEKEILQTFKVKLAPYTNNVIKGSNFLQFMYGIDFSNMLKVKKTM